MQNTSGYTGCILTAIMHKIHEKIHTFHRFWADFSERISALLHFLSTSFRMRHNLIIRPTINKIINPTLITYWKMDRQTTEVLRAYNFTTTDQLIQRILSTNNSVFIRYNNSGYQLTYDKFRRNFTLSGGNFMAPVGNVCPFSDCSHQFPWKQCEPRLRDFVDKFVPSKLFIPLLDLHRIRNEDMQWALHEMRKKRILGHISSPDQQRIQMHEYIKKYGQILTGSMTFRFSVASQQNIRFEDCHEGIKATLCANFPSCFDKGINKKFGRWYCNDCDSKISPEVPTLIGTREEGLKWMKEYFSLTADLVCSPNIPDLTSMDSLYGQQFVLEKLKKAENAGYSFAFDNQWIKIFINADGQLCFQFENDSSENLFKSCLYCGCFKPPLQDGVCEGETKPENIYCKNHLDKSPFINLSYPEWKSNEPHPTTTTTVAGATTTPTSVITKPQNDMVTELTTRFGLKFF